MNKLLAIAIAILFIQGCSLGGFGKYQPPTGDRYKPYPTGLPIQEIFRLGGFQRLVLEMPTERTQRFDSDGNLIEEVVRPLEERYASEPVLSPDGEQVIGYIHRHTKPATPFLAAKDASYKQPMGFWEAVVKVANFAAFGWGIDVAMNTIESVSTTRDPVIVQSTNDRLAAILDNPSGSQRIEVVP